MVVKDIIHGCMMMMTVGNEKFPVEGSSVRVCCLGAETKQMYHKK